MKPAAKGRSSATLAHLVWISSFVVLFSGCVETPGPTTSVSPSPRTPNRTVAYGLDLELPADWPSPGPFEENASEIENYVGFVTMTSGRGNSTCGHEFNAPRIAQHLEEEQYVRALEILFEECGRGSTRKAKALANDTLGKGTERAIFDRLYDDSQAHLAAALQWWNQTGPDTLLEIELAATMMREVFFIESSLRLSLRSMAAYEKNPTRIQLINAYLQAMTGTEAPMVSFIGAEYPWGAFSGCRVENVDALVNKTVSELQAVLEMARASSEPDDDQSVSTMYGKLVRLTRPNLEEAANRTWWPFVLRSRMYLSWDRGYWENISAPRLPDREEAKYLIASFRNTTRTVLTDASVLSLLNDAEAEAFPWERMQTQAREILALPSLRPLGRDLVCT